MSTLFVGAGLVIGCVVWALSIIVATIRWGLVGLLVIACFPPAAAAFPIIMWLIYGAPLLVILELMAVACLVTASALDRPATA